MDRFVIQLPRFLTESNQVKIITTNALVLVGLLILCEVSHRAIRLTKSCMRAACDYTSFSLFPVEYRRADLSLTTYSAELGYIPTPSLSRLINIRGWKNVVVSHDANGFRRSSPENSNKPNSILTVGDSFAYGAQVSDNQTWQSCLNKKIPDLRFVNGGVLGYGTAQSVLRAEYAMKESQFRGLLVQTLIGSDLDRDRYRLLWGLSRPYFTFDKLSNLVQINRPVARETPGSKYGKSMATMLDYLIANVTLFDRYLPLQSIRRDSVNRLTHSTSIMAPEAASIRDILEWSIARSSLLNTKVAWLLQYPQVITPEILVERQLVRERLANSSVPFIDTYDFLHGRSDVDLGDLYDGHHTPKGNIAVCGIIKEKVKLFREEGVVAQE